MRLATPREAAPTDDLTRDARSASRAGGAPPAACSAVQVIAADAPTLTCAAELLLTRVLQTLIAMIPAQVALGLRVGDRKTVERIIVLGALPGDAERAMRLIRRLRDLEPIDPFNPRRADAARANVLWAALAGGDDAVAASMYGRHLHRHGYGAPIVAYFRSEGRIASGLLLLRSLDARPFDAADASLLLDLHPFLEAALAMAAAPPQQPPSGLGTEGLTPREAEVARRVAHGLSNAAIAMELGMSEATVKAHLTRVYAKLGVRSRTQLAVLSSRLPEAAISAADVGPDVERGSASHDAHV